MEGGKRGKGKRETGRFDETACAFLQVASLRRYNPDQVQGVSAAFGKTLGILRATGPPPATNVLCAFFEGKVNADVCLMKCV